MPSNVHNTTPPHSNTIAGNIFNQKTVVEELGKGTRNMCCDRNMSNYYYTPVGHVVTGDLGIVKDTKLQSLKKGLS